MYSKKKNLHVGVKKQIALVVSVPGIGRVIGTTNGDTQVGQGELIPGTYAHNDRNDVRFAWRFGDRRNRAVRSSYYSYSTNR